MKHISTDKVGHFVVGALFAGAVVLAGALFGVASAWWPVLALCAGVLAGVGREAWQARTQRGTVDMRDAFATTAGGLGVAMGLAWGTALVWLYIGLALILAALWIASAKPTTAAPAPDAEIQEGGPRPRPPR